MSLSCLKRSPVQELANRMAEKGSDLVKALFKMGNRQPINDSIDQDTAELLVEEFGHNITFACPIPTLILCMTKTSMMPKR